jgi:hypothetical protein
MAKFLTHLYQGNGCDYTISCGETIYEFEAFSKEGIENQIKERIEYYGRENIQKVTFYEITENKAEINIYNLFASDDAKDAADAKVKEEAEERKILEDLKNKYPDA